MNKYNIDRLKDQLEYDEGVVYEIYSCPAGYLTFGVGHKITESDREWGWGEGTPVAHHRVWEVFNQDVEMAIKGCENIYGEDQFYSWPPEVQEILINMCFNLGQGGLSKFKKMNNALHHRDWNLAAQEGRDSLWYAQVTKRAERLMSRLESIEL